MPRHFVCLLLLAASAFAAVLPTPEQFAGFRMGTDKKLIRWDKIVDYMKMADAASDRIQVQELGKTSNGNPYLNVVITAPQTIADLERYRSVQKRIAYPYDLPPNEFEAIAAQHKAVLLITCNIHASEIGASQMVLELVHRLATEDSPYVKHVLDNVIFLLVPSANPDGQIMVVDWYNKNVGTPYEYSLLPELYHKYTGHDNNRDAFMNTQAESRLLNKLTYRDWFPQVYLDEHQMGSNGPRIFVPPFKNPVNPNVDPSIWQLNGMLGYAMGAALHDKGYTGIINDAMYTSWWQGGFVMQAWWHNMVGVLTEVASVAVATPVEQQTAKPGAPAPPVTEPARPAEPRDPKLPLTAPSDVTPRNTYPRPWLGGKWTLRDIVDYELTATWGLLQAVADNRLVLLRNFYRMNRRGIEAGTKEAPYAWVIPTDQHDRPAAARMVQILDELGVEVHQAGAQFEAAGRKYPAGSYVVKMAQPFRAFAKDLLEKQKYPEQRATPGGPVERPYDVTGWTLPLQMGVDAVEVAKAFDARLEPLKTIPIPAGRFEGNGRFFEVSGKTNHSSLAANRLLKAGSKVWWTPAGFTVEGKAAELKNWAASLGVDVTAKSSAPSSAKAMKPVRLAIYHPSLPNMDEGWTRWLLEQYEFGYTPIGNQELRKGGLQSRFDAILFADQSKDSILKGVTNAWTRPEHKDGIGEEGVAALKDFVRSGGTLITLGTSSLVPVEEFPLPLKNALKGLRPDQFSCPGSILKVFIDNTSPVGFGMRDKASAVFYNDIAFEPAPGIGDAEVRVVARYPSGGLLESGWIGGEQYLQDRIAAADVRYGKGRVIVLGFSVQNRAQPHGTFKLLFNAIHLAGAGD